MAIEEDLRRAYRDPEGKEPHFTTLIAPGGHGVVTIPMPDGNGQCLPVFSTPFRAVDYRQCLLADEPPGQYLASTAAQLSEWLPDVKKAGVDGLTLDRCPRCSILTVIAVGSLTPSDLLSLWTIQKATELARLRLYLDYAITSARRGQLAVALDIALETVGHVSIEDPRAHLLLGELAVGLGDRQLLGEAQAFLRFFEYAPWEQKLATIVESGNTLFNNYE